MEIECLPFMYKVLSSIFSSTHTNTIDTYLCTHFLGINVTFQGLKLLDHKGSTCLAVKLSLLLSGKHWAFFLQSNNSNLLTYGSDKTGPLYPRVTLNLSSFCLSIFCVEITGLNHSFTICCFLKMFHYIHDTVSFPQKYRC